MERPSLRRPDWRKGYVDSFLRIRDQLRRDRANAHARVVYVGEESFVVASMSDADIDAYAWREAQRTAEESIQRWNAGEDERKRRLGEL